MSDQIKTYIMRYIEYTMASLVMLLLFLGGLIELHYLDGSKYVPWGWVGSLGAFIMTGHFANRSDHYIQLSQRTALHGDRQEFQSFDGF